MKKSIKYILFFVFLVLFISGCSGYLMNNGTGTVIIQTPAEIHPAMKSIYNGVNGSTLITDFNQNYFRYEIIVESRGNRILYKNFGRDEKGVLNVPTGIPLNIFVGVYYAQNGRSDKELYNVYLATDSIENVTLMPGESERLRFKLDVNRGLRVDTYFFDFAGLISNTGNVTGGVMGFTAAGALRPYFTIDPFGSVNSWAMYYQGSNFTVTDRFDTTFFSSAFTPNGKGKIFYLSTDPSSNPYWLIYNGNIYSGGNIDQIRTSSFVTITSGVSGLLYNVNSIDGLDSLNGTTTYANYFLSYGQGYIGLQHHFNQAGGGWTSSVYNSDLAAYSSIYPYENFILDAEQIFFDNGLLATKIGLFHLDNTALNQYYQGDIQQALLNSIKLIKITNPADSRTSLLIKKLLSYTSRNQEDNLLLLGTTRGIYFIDRGSNDWNNFTGASFTGSNVIFPERSIHKMDQLGNESVVSMDINNLSVNNYTYSILTVVTTKRILFYNLDTGKSDMISLFDGLPFIPIQYEAYGKFNKLDYKTHEAAPVKFVLWDQNNGSINGINGRYWICTDFGLASVDAGNLDL